MISLENRHQEPTNRPDGLDSIEESEEYQLDTCVKVNTMSFHENSVGCLGVLGRLQKTERESKKA